MEKQNLFSFPTLKNNIFRGFSQDCFLFENFLFNNALDCSIFIFFKSAAMKHFFSVSFGVDCKSKHLVFIQLGFCLTSLLWSSQNLQLLSYTIFLTMSHLSSAFPCSAFLLVMLQAVLSLLCNI